MPTTDRTAGAPIGEALRVTLIPVAITAALLLIPAGMTPGGTWLWWRGIWFVAGSGAINLGGALALAIRRPAHFRVRRQSIVAARSTAALGGVAVLLAMTLGRIWIEEQELRARLPAYADYARRVRGRLIPFLI